MFRFVARVGAAGTACYYVCKEGVWGDSNTTLELYNRLCTSSQPYVDQMKEKLPLELPELPTRDRVSFLAVYYWNEGVKTSFRFLADLPVNSVRWSKKLTQSDSVQQLLGSVSQSTQEIKK